VIAGLDGDDPERSSLIGKSGKSSAAPAVEASSTKMLGGQAVGRSLRHRWGKWLGSCSAAFVGSLNTIHGRYLSKVGPVQCVFIAVRPLLGY